MRRDRRFRYDWDRKEQEGPERRRHQRPDIGRMIIKWLPWAIVAGIALFFLERWLKG